MISVVDALNQIVVPAVQDVFEDGEILAVAVRLDSELDGELITVSLTAVGEDFYDLVVQGGVDGDVTAWRERLRSDMADWVAESRFGWGQNRGV